MLSLTPGKHFPRGYAKELEQNTAILNVMISNNATAAVLSGDRAVIAGPIADANGNSCGDQPFSPSIKLSSKIEAGRCPCILAASHAVGFVASSLPSHAIYKVKYASLALRLAHKPSYIWSTSYLFTPWHQLLGDVSFFPLLSSLAYSQEATGVIKMSLIIKQRDASILMNWNYLWRITQEDG